jgi:hypothetical protein
MNPSSFRSVLWFSHAQLSATHTGHASRAEVRDMLERIPWKGRIIKTLGKRRIH